MWLGLKCPIILAVSFLTPLNGVLEASAVDYCNRLKVSKMHPTTQLMLDRQKCKNVYAGRRCRNASTVGSNTCLKCRIAKLQAIKGGDKVRYSAVLGPTLKQALAEQSVSNLDDRCSLMDELTLVRDAAMAPIRLYSNAKELHGASLTPEQAEESYAALTVSAERMLNSLEHVKEFALSASKILNDARKSYSVHDLNVVIEQFLGMVASRLGTDNNVLDGLREEMGEQLLLPERAFSVSGQALAVEVNAEQIAEQFETMGESVPINKESTMEVTEVA